MAKQKKSYRKKNTFTLKRQPRQRLTLIIFISVFALFGAYLIFKSFANPLPIPKGEKVIMERRNTTDGSADGVLLQDAETVSFRVYASGLAVCGGYTDASHPEQYYSTQLTPTEISGLVNSIKQTGFFDLNKTLGYGGNVTSTNYQEISILQNNVGKSVVADPYFTPKPAAYDNTNAIIDAFCAPLTTVYQPENIEVTTKVVPDSIPADGGTLSPTSSVNETATVSQTKKISGTEAMVLHNSLGKTGKKVFKKQGKTVEVRADQVLPPELNIQDSISPPKYSVRVPSFSSPFAMAKVSAAAQPVKYYVFCASDNCSIPQNLATYISTSKAFYKRNINQTYAAQNIGKYQGRRPLLWYRECHGYYSSPTCGSNDPLANILANVTHEILVTRGWTSDGPRVFILGFTAFETQNACGVAYIGQTSLLTGVVSTTPAAGGNCVTGGYQYDSAAHELGHEFGLSHVTDGTLMNPSACNGVPVTVCKINGLQGIWLQVNSKFLN